MEILLIGNGFDIEHKLPTSYNDFLLFCLKVMPIFSVEPGLTIQRYTNDYLESWKIDESVKKTLTAAFNSRYEDKASVTETEYDTGIRTARILPRSILTPTPRFRNATSFWAVFRVRTSLSSGSSPD